MGAAKSCPAARFLGHPLCPRTPRVCPREQAGGWHLTGTGLSRGGQYLRSVSARPEALPGFGPGAGGQKQRDKQARTPATCVCEMGTAAVPFKRL